MKRIGIIALSLIVIVAGGFSFLIHRNFYPGDRYEIPSTGPNRLFAFAPQSADETILIEAADWPHTFFKPVILGDAVSSDKFHAAKIRWSRDGSIAALCAVERGKNEERYLSAYDFGAHQALGTGADNFAGHSFHDAIARIMEAKGAGSPVEIPMLNSGLYRR